MYLSVPSTLYPYKAPHRGKAAPNGQTCKHAQLLDGINGVRIVG